MKFTHTKKKRINKIFTKTKISKASIKKAINEFEKGKL